MKKILFGVVMLISSVQILAARDVVTSDTMKLPAKAREFVQQHFNGYDISYIKIDKEFLLGDTYEVFLTNGMEIEFDSKGKCIDIDAKKNRVPESIVPENISAYVEKTFDKNFITQIEYKRREIKVELNNDLEIVFDKKGNFIRLDD